MLKNNKKALPINSSLKIAVLGNSSYDLIVGGTGSGNVNRKYKVSLIDALKDSNIKTDANVANRYATYLKIEKEKLPADNFWSANRIRELSLEVSEIESLAQDNDVAVLSIGRISGEGDDRNIEGDYSLLPNEKPYCTMYHKPFIKKARKL